MAAILFFYALASEVLALAVFTRSLIELETALSAVHQDQAIALKTALNITAQLILAVVALSRRTWLGRRLRELDATTIVTMVTVFLAMLMKTPHEYTEPAKLSAHLGTVVGLFGVMRAIHEGLQILK